MRGRVVRHAHGRVLLETFAADRQQALDSSFRLVPGLACPAGSPAAAPCVSLYAPSAGGFLAAAAEGAGPVSARRGALAVIALRVERPLAAWGAGPANVSCAAGPTERAACARATFFLEPQGAPP
eukprot:tig00020510_g9832.t1